VTVAEVAIKNVHKYKKVFSITMRDLTISTTDELTEVSTMQVVYHIERFIRHTEKVYRSAGKDLASHRGNPFETT